MVTQPEMRRRDHERDAHDQERGETGRTGQETLMVVSLASFKGSAVTGRSRCRPHKRRSICNI